MLSNKKLILVISVLLTGLVLTVLLALKQQETRSHADTSNAANFLISPLNYTGHEADVTVSIDGGQNTVTGISTTISVNIDNPSAFQDVTFTPSSDFDHILVSNYDKNTGKLTFSATDIDTPSTTAHNLGTLKFIGSQNAGHATVIYTPDIAHTQVVALGKPDIALTVPATSFSGNYTVTGGGGGGTAQAFHEFEGILSLDAEDFSAANSISRTDRANNVHTWIQGNDAQASQGHYISTLNKKQIFNAGEGAQINYPVYFSTTGIYKIWIRGYAPSGRGNAAYVGMDGQGPQTAITISKYDRWVWDNTDLNKKSMTITINSAGAHTINLWERKDGLRVDKIVIQKSDTKPTGTGPAHSAFY